MVLWNGARSVCYHIVRVHQQRKCDTLYVTAAMLQGKTQDLVWVKKDEIRYFGKMFDIKRKINHPGEKVSLVGHYDKAEDKLFKILRKLVDAEKEQGKENSAQLVWSFIAILPQQPPFLLQMIPGIPVTIPPYVARVYISPRHSPPVPPPDVAAC